ncbi:phosphomannomutase-like [Primulina huaijiensis]|uniref:phosphomannomutase-like n=1 Tax=Primulina huaijiensis TaxID=1492673 RepID=UPI003CC78D2B
MTRFLAIYHFRVSLSALSLHLQRGIKLFILVTDVVKKSVLIALFDVDGTLTAPRKISTTKMLEFMRELRKVVMVGVVGGSDLVKISEQLGQTVTTTVFAENGLVAYKDGMLIGTQSLKSFLGDEKLKIHNVRSKMVFVLCEKFAHFNLTFSIGGQISFDVRNIDCFSRYSIYC